MVYFSALAFGGLGGGEVSQSGSRPSTSASETAKAHSPVARSWCSSLTREYAPNKTENPASRRLKVWRISPTAMEAARLAAAGIDCRRTRQPQRKLSRRLGRRRAKPSKWPEPRRTPDRNCNRREES